MCALLINLTAIIVIGQMQVLPANYTQTVAAKVFFAIINLEAHRIFANCLSSRPLHLSLTTHR